jgi:hypothetical protein
MGEAHGCVFAPTFNQSIKVRQADSRVSSDAGAILLREADHRLGLTADLAAGLIDPRDPSRSRYTHAELLREHLYALALGYAHQYDVDRLAHDPAMKVAVWDRPGQQVLHERLGSQPSDWRLVRRIADFPTNLEAVRESLAESIGRDQRASGAGRKVAAGTLDIDPMPIEVHGSQPGAAWHGHYHAKIYYPMLASFCAEGNYDANRLGEGFVHAALRRGDCGGADGAVPFVQEAIRKSRDLACRLDVRIDAGLVEGKVLDAIDDESVCFVGRIRNNAVLDGLATPFLKRPPGRPSAEGDEFALDLGTYQAATWTRAYRLVLVVIDLPDPKTHLRALFPHYFLLITNWPAEKLGAWELLQHYRKRGTFEDRLGEFNGMVGNGLSANSFDANEAAPLLKLLAFNLAGMIRGELEASTGNGWDLRRVQQTVLKAGARLTKHSRRVFVDVAGAVGALWERVTNRMRRW